MRGAQDGGDGVDFGFGDIGAQRGMSMELVRSGVSMLSTARGIASPDFRHERRGCLMSRSSSGTVARTWAMVRAAVPSP